MRIYKYPLELTDYQNVQMPSGASILSVANQNGVVTLWAMVNTTNEPGSRQIVIIGTGHVVPNHTLKFIGTVQIGIFVWHVFERT